MVGQRQRHDVGVLAAQAHFLAQAQHGGGLVLDLGVEGGGRHVAVAADPALEGRLPGLLPARQLLVQRLQQALGQRPDEGRLALVGAPPARVEVAHLADADALQPFDALVQAGDVVRVAGRHAAGAVVVLAHGRLADRLGVGLAVAQALHGVAPRALEGVSRQARRLQRLEGQAQQFDEALALALQAQRQALAAGADVEATLQTHRLVDEALTVDAGRALADQAADETRLVRGVQRLGLAPAQAQLAHHLFAAAALGQQGQLDAAPGQGLPLGAALQVERRGVELLAGADLLAGQAVEVGAAVGHRGHADRTALLGRLVARQRAVVGREVAAGDALHILERERGHIAAQLEDQAPIARRHRLGEQLRQALRLLEQLAVAERELVAHALELLGAQRHALALLDGGDQRQRQLLHRHPGGRYREDVEEPGVVPAAAPRPHACGQLLVLDEALVQRAAGRLRQHLPEQVERRAVGVGEGRHVVGQQQGLLAADAAHHHAALAVLRRLHRVAQGLGGGRVLQRAEQRVDARQRGRRVELAGDDERGVVGPVMRLVEAPQRLDGHVLHVAARADGRAAVGVEAVGRRHQALAQQLAGVVLALLQLVHHHRHFLGQVLGLDAALLHALALQAQHEVERVATGVEGAEVVRAVVARGGVEAHPALAHGLGDVGHRGHALEQEVLEQVRHAGLARALVAAADAVDDVGQAGGGRRVGKQQHLQAVGQPVLLDALQLAHRLRFGQRGRHGLRGGRCGGCWRSGSRGRSGGGRLGCLGRNCGLGGLGGLGGHAEREGQAQGAEDQGGGVAWHAMTPKTKRPRCKRGRGSAYQRASRHARIRRWRWRWSGPWRCALSSPPGR